MISNFTNKNVSVLGLKPIGRTLTFWGLYKNYKTQLIVGFFWLLATASISLLLPRLINLGVSLIEQQTAVSISLDMFELRLDDVWTLVQVIVFLALVGGVVRTMSRKVLLGIGRSIENDVRKSLFYHLSTLSSSFYRRFSVGDLLSHITNDSTNIRLATGFAVLNTLNISIIFVGTVPILYSIDPIVATFALLPFPLVMLVARLLSGQMFGRTKVYQEALSSLTSHVQENLNAIQVVKVFGQESKEESKFAKKNDSTFKSAMRLATIRIALFPLMRLMGGLGAALTLFVGGRAVAKGTLTLGEFVEINTRLVQLAWPAVSLGFIITMYHRGRASLERINKIIAERPDIVDGDYEGSTNAYIAAKGLSVKVDGGQTLVCGLDFELKKGQVLGVVGPSGAGKTSLVRAIMRQAKISPGQLLFGGQDALSWHLQSLFTQVALVPSEPFLFSMSLRDNIIFANPNLDDKELLQVVDAVGLTPDIDRFPDGLETIVGERGVTLSGGQRQRVALARAIVAHPQILVLDDSLSAVDVQTEKKITNALKKNEFVKTLVIVSHRLSALTHASEILVLDKGAIVERGTHEELMQHGKLYRALWGLEQLETSLEHGIEAQL